MKGHWQYMILAVVLALFSWNLVSGRDKVESTVEVPVNVTGTPSSLVVKEGLPAKLEVRIRGPRGYIRSMNTANLAYELDLSDLELGDNEVVFRARGIPLPGGLEIVAVTPESAMIRTEAVVERILPVAPVYKADLPEGWQAYQVLSSPAEVKVRGPASLVEAMHEVRTTPLTIRGEAPEDVAAELALAPPAGVEARPQRVQVALRFGPERAEFELAVPVALPTDLVSRVRLDPAKVRLRLRAPKLLAAAPDQLAGRIKVELPTAALRPGERDSNYTVSLPPRVELISAQPDVIGVSVAQPAASGPEPEPTPEQTPEAGSATVPGEKGGSGNTSDMTIPQSP